MRRAVAYGSHPGSSRRTVGDTENLQMREMLYLNAPASFMRIEGIEVRDDHVIIPSVPTSLRHR